MIVQTLASSLAHQSHDDPASTEASYNPYLWCTTLDPEPLAQNPWPRTLDPDAEPLLVVGILALASQLVHPSTGTSSIGGWTPDVYK